MDMMETKRRKESNISIVPLDCWSHVVVFLSKQEDLLSLLLVVRGLYEHISFISPRCTRSVVFCPVRLPEKKLLHVTNVGVELCFASDFDDFGENDFSHLFVSLSRLLPNLESLGFFSEPPTMYGEIRRRNRGNFVGDWEYHSFSTLHLALPPTLSLEKSFLKVLVIDVRTSNKFDFDPPLLVNLEKLVIDTHKYNMRRHVFDGLRERERSRFNWEKVPRLKYLSISFCDLDSSLDGLRKRLEVLILEDCSLKEEDFHLSDFEKLVELKLTQKSITQIKSIDRTNKVQKLHLVGPSAINFDIGLDFPQLEELRMLSAVEEIATNNSDIVWGDPMRLRYRIPCLYLGIDVGPCLVLKHPKLKIIDMNGILFPVRICNFQYPLSLNLNSCRDVDFDDSLRTNMELLKRVFSVKVHVLRFRPNLRAFLSDMKGLGNVMSKIKREDLLLRPLYMNTVDRMDGFLNLSRIELLEGDIRLAFIKNCPKLTFASFPYGSFFQAIENCPLLKEIAIRAPETASFDQLTFKSPFDDEEQTQPERISIHLTDTIAARWGDTTFQSNFGRFLLNTPIKFVRVHENPVNLVFDGENCSVVKGLSFLDRPSGSFSEAREVFHMKSLTLKNFPHLFTLVDSSFPFEYSLVNLPKLSELALLDSPMNNTVEAVFSLHLENLPSLKVLTINLAFFRLPEKNVLIKNTNIAHLIVDYNKQDYVMRKILRKSSELEKAIREEFEEEHKKKKKVKKSIKNSGTILHVPKISDKYFPQLEKITFREIFDERIGSAAEGGLVEISNLKKLSTIVMDTTIPLYPKRNVQAKEQLEQERRFMNRSCVGKIFGLDFEKIVVHSRYTISHQSIRYAGKKVVEETECLREYAERTKIY